VSETQDRPSAPGELIGAPSRAAGDIEAYFLSEEEQTSQEVASRLAAFIAGARRSLDIAIYDFRLSDPLKAIVADALAERAQTGVAVRIAYDADKPPMPHWDVGLDPAPAGTGAFVQSLGYPWRRIGGLKLMHNKLCVSLSARSGAPSPGARSSSVSTSPAASRPAVRSNSTM
jgi:phosphatidylserine/phosphatidylglycerophosphate/cardiolipin synthase-like enzyme